MSARTSRAAVRRSREWGTSAPAPVRNFLRPYVAAAVRINLVKRDEPPDLLLWRHPATSQESHQGLVPRSTPGGDQVVDRGAGDGCPGVPAAPSHAGQGTSARVHQRAQAPRELDRGGGAGGIRGYRRHGCGAHLPRPRPDSHRLRASSQRRSLFGRLPGTSTQLRMSSMHRGFLVARAALGVIISGLPTFVSA